MTRSIIGLEDFSLYRINTLATSALVLLLRSISGNWKQPIGYYLVNGGCQRDEFESIMKRAIDRVESIGLNVVAVLSDMGSNFHSLALYLNITPEHPWFIHNDKKYFVMFDPPHLIKSLRNNLMKYSFRFGQHVATWKDIEDLYMKDSLPTNFNKMRVKLATQVLSHTVAASLCTYASLGGLPSTAMGTSEFLSKFDSVFDCVNCSTLHSTKNLKCPLNDTSPNKEFMKEAIIFIKGLKVFNGNEEVTGRIKCLKGWAITLSATLAIWDHLKANHAFKYILTRKLNTDPIENFFGTIRQKGGNNDNPTPVQSLSAFRKLFFSSFLTSSAGNCAADFDDLIAQCTENKESSTSVLATTTQPQTLAIGPTDNKDPSVVSNI